MTERSTTEEGDGVGSDAEGRAVGDAGAADGDALGEGEKLGADEPLQPVRPSVTSRQAVVA